MTPESVVRSRDGWSRTPTAALRSIAHALPAHEVTSEEVEERVRSHERRGRIPTGFIERATGVRARRYRSPDQNCSDFAAEAAVAAMDQIGVAATEIDVVIFGAASQDVSEPATASIIQSKLGCTNAFVFDVKNACSSFINSLDLALCLIEAHRASRVLVTSGEVLSLSIDWQIVSPSRSPEKLAGLTLGDGGAAAIVELSDEADESRLYPSELFSDGTLWEASTVYAGGSMYGFDQVRGYFECSSGPLVRAAAEHLPRLIDLACDRLGWTLDSVAAVVPHQVSAHHIDFLQSLGFRDGVVRQTVQHLGNVAAASIPITLSIEVAAGRIRRGDRVLLLSGAAGFNAGVTPIVW